jgi:3-oxoacyl-[acyl-carrier protein] reductase
MKGKILVFRHDVTDPKSWQALLETVLFKFGRCDVLINNAGVAQPGFAEDLSLEKINQQVSVNLLGMMYGCRAALKIMKAQGFGKIINIASLGAIVPLPGEAVYCATKYAVRGYTFSLQAELLNSPVEACVVCPDSVETPQLEYELQHDEALLSFVDKPLKPEAAAQAILRAVKTHKPEILVPPGMGILSRAAMAFPQIYFFILPILKKIGIREISKRRREKQFDKRIKTISIT